MNINQELKQLYSDVEAELKRKNEKSRRRRLAALACELDLKRGTDLALSELAVSRSPALVSKFERRVGVDMLLYCVNTRAGMIFVRAAIEDGRDPVVEIARLIARGARFYAKAEQKRRKNRG
jgi:hypothetical protein